MPAHPRILVLAAFATVYLVWGSTYFAIRIAIETLPPFLFAGVRLRHEQVVDLDAEFFGIGRIECMFGIDEGRRAAGTLGRSDDLQCQRGLAGRFRSVDLDDATARQTADTERDVEAKRASRDRFDHVGLAVTHAHDRALAELLLDLRKRSRQRTALVVVHDPFLDSLGCVPTLSRSCVSGIETGQRMDR